MMSEAQRQKRYAWTREWRKRNKDHVRAYSKQYALNHPELGKSPEALAKRRAYHYQNREACLARSRNYYRSNKDAFLKSCKIRYELNKEKILASQKGYYNRNKEVILEKCRKYKNSHPDVW